MQIKSLKQYEREVRRTFGSHENEISCYALGLAGEVGEVVDLLKKAWGHGHPLDSEKLKKELGDSIWYVVALALQFDIGIERITPRRLIDDIGPDHRGQRALFLTTLVGCVNHRLLRIWYSDSWKDALFEKRLARDLTGLFDQLEQLGLDNSIGLLDILQANVDKLRLRYPEGFSTAASIARFDVVPGVAKRVDCPLRIDAGGSTVGHDTKKAIERYIAARPEQTIPDWHDSSCAPMDPSLDMT